MNRVTLLIISTLAVICLTAVLAVLIARGYQFDPSSGSLLPTGILVATSDPDGAQVYINESLKTATNNTINLAPGEYDIEIAKDGYSPWKKKVEIKKEEVYKTNVFLFPKVPDLRPLTFSGATKPTLSPDQTKIAFVVSSASGERNGIWVLDMSRSPLTTPLASAGDQRQIFREGTLFQSLLEANLLWSADSKQIIAYFGEEPKLATSSGLPAMIEPPVLGSLTQSAFILDVDRLNDSPSNIILELPNLLSSWKEFISNRKKAQMAKLSKSLAAVLTSAATNITFSPDESKILYTATASAEIPPVISIYIPGKNPTIEERKISPGSLYVYDIKEDKNYLIKKDYQASLLPVKPGGTKQVDPVEPLISWFPSSRHLLDYNSKEISVREYDSTNRAVVYAGPFVDHYVFAWPNWSKIVILTSLNQAAGIGENLYTINLR